MWSRSFLARISDSLLVNGKLGDEMKKDGIPFLEKAAEANDPYGTLNLGLAYLSGTVIALDREKGKALVKNAADLGLMTPRRCWRASPKKEEDTVPQPKTTKAPEVFLTFGLCSYIEPRFAACLPGPAIKEVYLILYRTNVF